ncbi:MATE family efflux transporter [Streptomyces sp. CB01881]|uniref:MATE family efflux transporter n=1 Tax=Streptomyces sp. CB01881 TaxID=2078691 RepID=UPI000CDCB506|nr:MATE family efflux transporter [Streptomyces sp. CB01881]AUY53754.1 hypothetical protein C2142_38580 [Streptomyces sp. CB01881]TYC68765.1 MATE family efflux transporter [Streptomyces sp. CB01881]
MDAERRETFISFLRWTSAANLLAVGTELCASSLRGYGYVRHATLLVFCTASVRIGLVAGLGLGTDVGIAAVPVAEATAGLTGLTMGLVLLRRTELWHPPAVLIWRREVLTGLRRIGVPIAMSLLLISAYNVAVIGVLGNYGQDAVAGFTVVSTMQNVVLLPGMVLGTATAITINQLRGKGDWQRMRALMRGGIEVTVMVYVAIAVLVWLVHEPLARLISGDAGVAYCNLIGVSVPLVAVRHIRKLSAEGSARTAATTG